MRFTGVCLISEDVPRMIRFYSELLQSEPEGDEVHAEFAFTGAGLTIYTRAGTESMAPGATAGMGTGAGILGFEVPDVDAEYERLRALGAPIVKAPETYPWGARSVWTRDPDGNIVNLFQRVNPTE